MCSKTKIGKYVTVGVKDGEKEGEFVGLNVGSFLTKIQ